jgi:hypothetical protein
MTFSLTRHKRKHAILLLGVVTFVFHALTPYFHPAMANAPDGFNQSICSVEGQKTVFVTFEDEQQQSPARCYECPACIVQANASGWIEADTPLVEAGFLLHISEQIEPFYRIPTKLFYPHFLSRAPPL